MVADAQHHAAEDRRQREAVEARHQADTGAYQVERQLHELGDRVPMHERARAENMIQEIRQLVKDQSTDMARCGSSRATCNSLPPAWSRAAMLRRRPGLRAGGNVVVPRMRSLTRSLNHGVKGEAYDDTD